MVLTDADVARWQPGPAIAAMRAAVVAAHRGELVAPPRVQTELGGGRLVFTTGRRPGRWYGYRCYDAFAGRTGDQTVAVFDDRDGSLRGWYVGRDLGPRRVGAIGGVAIDVLARRGASSLALIGTGVQAWNQLWAARAVRPLREVRVFSRDPERRRAFAARARAGLGVPAEPAPSAEAAVTGADLVVLATDSAVPVIDPAWIRRGAFVTTVGPKQVGRAEFGPELVAVADVATADSLDQVDAYRPPNVLVGTEQRGRLVHLGAVVTGDTPGRTDPDQITLCCSVGLAGTEAWLLATHVGLEPGPAFDGSSS